MADRHADSGKFRRSRGAALNMTSATDSVIRNSGRVYRAGEPSRRRDARISVVLAVLLGVTVLVIVTGVIVIHVLSRDEPPPNAMDLKVVRLELRDDKNAFSYFEKAAAEVYWPKERELEEDRLWEMQLSASNWDQELVSDFLKANDRMFAHLDEGLTLAVCQVPEVKDNFQKLDYLDSWRHMALIARLRALHDFKEGRESRAFQRAMEVVKFGHTIDNSGGTVIHLLTGNMVEQVGLRAIRELLAKTTLTQDQLRPFIEWVGACETNREAVCNAYRAEYQFFLCTVDDVAAGNGPRYGLPRISHAHGFLFKANETSRLYADYIRWAIRNATRPRSEWEPAPPEDVRWLTGAKGAGRPSVMTGNGVGKILLATAAPNLDGINLMACRTNWSL